VAGHPAWPGVVWPHLGRPFGGGRTTPSGPRGGSAAPWAKRKFEHLAQGVAKPPLGPNAQNFVFGHLAQGAAEPPPGPLGVVRPPPGRLAWGRPNHPRPNGVAGHTYGVEPSQHIFLIFFFFFFKCDGGILRINRLNGLNCHNLKV
jgi:hypothetical protein